MLRPSKPRITPRAMSSAGFVSRQQRPLLVASHSNLIDAAIAPEGIQRHGRCAGRNGDTTCGSCQDDDLVGHRDLQLTIMMIAKRLLRRMVTASAMAYASRYPGLILQLSHSVACASQKNSKDTSTPGSNEFRLPTPARLSEPAPSRPRPRASTENLVLTRPAMPGRV
jgi:hypothetical protein